MAKRTDSERTILSVKDFGPIAEANVELRPFTVFVGASNTGKSYLAILLYALHQFFGRARGASQLGLQPWDDRQLFSPGLHQSSDERPTSPEALDATINWLTQVSDSLDDTHRQQTVDLDLPDRVAAAVRPVLEGVGDLAPLLNAEVARCFGVAATESLIRREGGRAAGVALHRNADEGTVASRVIRYDFAIARSGLQLTASVPDDLPLRVHGQHGHSLRMRALPPAAIRTPSLRTFPQELADWVVRHALGTVTRPVHYLPAGRTGVVQAQRAVMSSLIRGAARTGFDVEPPPPGLSGVIADFLARLVELGQAELNGPTNPQLAEQLEGDILGGAVRVHQTSFGYPSFRYQPAKWKDDLPLMNTSSMVSELAPVVLYLRHIVRPGDVLIIEEPESHLHPAMQVALTRSLAAVVQAGIRVVVTTHSEWVLEALANLVRLSALDKSRRKADEDLMLTPDQVGAWLFERKKRPNGSVVRELPLDIESGTFPAGFGEITEALYNHWAGICNRVAEQSA